MKRIILCGAHDGNVVNGLVPVAKEFVRQGHEVLVILPDGHSAAGNYQRQESLRVLLADIPVKIETRVPAAILADAIVLALSPVIGKNLEIGLLKAANDQGIPAYGLEEVISGRHNPGWRTLRWYPMSRQLIPNS
jgi:hypothetical protein